MRIILKLSLSALVVSLLASCAEHAAGGEPLAPNAFQEWKDNEPRDYVVQVCTMNIEPPGCQRALIEDGEVVSAAERIYAFGGADYGWEDFSAEDRDEAGSPLDWMFTKATGADDEDCVIDDIRYEGEYGYIDSYEVLCDGHPLGGHYVACFEPDADDVEACDVAPE